MSLSLDPRPFSSKTFTVGHNTPLLCDPGPWSNTRFVRFKNIEPTVGGIRLFIRIIDAAAGAPVAADLTEANSLILDPQEAITFDLGPEGERYSLGTVTPNAAQSAYAIRLAIYFLSDPLAPAPGLTKVNVTFVQCRGYTGPA
jgi:hypothetical protein